MDRITFFRDLAIIIVSAKLFGLLAQKLKAPQVVGEIIAGLIIGPSCLGLMGGADYAGADYLSLLSEIGVVMLCFQPVSELI